MGAADGLAGCRSLIQSTDAGSLDAEQSELLVEKVVSESTKVAAARRATGLDIDTFVSRPAAFGEQYVGGLVSAPKRAHRSRL